ncbi:MAG TPA: hypothetical protein VFH01_08310 [Pyrinomonadaceae bacterium]|nr:hypothetical protein [Pyrinomonadaceae bacterium]
MKRLTALLIVILALCSANALGQTRKRTSKTPATRPAPMSGIHQAGKTRVGDQIKNLTRFLYLLGGVAKGIEAVDEAERRNEASPTVIEQAKRNKDTVRTSIKSVREGLDALEIHFRTTPELQRYYIKLAGVASGAATAEEQAAANQLDRAGRSLLDVVNRLTNVLTEMK